LPILTLSPGFLHCAAGLIEQRSNEVLQSYLTLKKEEEERVAAAAVAAAIAAKGASSAAAKSMANILGTPSHQRISLHYQLESRSAREQIETCNCLAPRDIHLITFSSIVSCDLGVGPNVPMGQDLIHVTPPKLEDYSSDEGRYETRDFLSLSHTDTHTHTERKAHTKLIHTKQAHTHTHTNILGRVESRAENHSSATHSLTCSI
jgi:hypothetical protein